MQGRITDAFERGLIRTSYPFIEAPPLPDLGGHGLEAVRQTDTSTEFFRI
jgi:hypothetical protein